MQMLGRAPAGPRMLFLPGIQLFGSGVLRLFIRRSGFGGSLLFTTALAVLRLAGNRLVTWPASIFFFRRHAAWVAPIVP